MDGDTVSELLAERRELKINASTVGRELRAAKQKAKDAERRASKVWQLSAFVVHVVVILYYRDNCVHTPAAKLLAKTAHRKKWPPKSDEELKTIIEDIYDEHGSDARLVDEHDPSDPAAMKEAVRWSEEWRVVCRIEDLNYKKGVAPPTASVLRLYEEGRASIPEGVRPEHKGEVSESRARKWAMRLRRRWGGRHGKLRVREHMAVEEMRGKARDYSKVGSDPEPKSGLGFRAHNWSRNPRPFLEPLSVLLWL